MLLLDAVKAHLRVDHCDEDALILEYINAAQEHLIGEFGLSQGLYGFMEQSEYFDDFGCFPLQSRFGGTIELVGIYWRDQSGVDQVITPAQVRVDKVIHGTGLCIDLLPDQAYPDRDQCIGQLEVRYRSVKDVPAPIRQAMLLLIGHYYRNREAVVVGTINSDLSMGVKNLMAPYRSYR